MLTGQHACFRITVYLAESHGYTSWLNLHADVTLPHLIWLRQLWIRIGPGPESRHSPLLDCHP